MGCLRLCGVRTAGEATRQAELSPFSIARLQHRIMFNMPSSIPPDGMISIITVKRHPGTYIVLYRSKTPGEPGLDLEPGHTHNCTHSPGTVRMTVRLNVNTTDATTVPRDLLLEVIPSSEVLYRKKTSGGAWTPVWDPGHVRCVYSERAVTVP